MCGANTNFCFVHMRSVVLTEKIQIQIVAPSEILVKDRKVLGENIDYGNSCAEDIVVSLVIDDGVPSRGHLRNIMKSSFRHAGAAIGPHKQYGFMCTIDFSD